jgi:hypothetical protein
VYYTFEVGFLTNDRGCATVAAITNPSFEFDSGSLDYWYPETLDPVNDDISLQSTTSYKDFQSGIDNFGWAVDITTSAGSTTALSTVFTTCPNTVYTSQMQVYLATAPPTGCDIVFGLLPTATNSGTVQNLTGFTVGDFSTMTSVDSIANTTNAILFVLVDCSDLDSLVAPSWTITVDSAFVSS